MARLSAGRDTPFPAQLIYTMIKLISVNDEYKYRISAHSSRALSAEERPGECWYVLMNVFILDLKGAWKPFVFEFS